MWLACWKKALSKHTKHNVCSHYGVLVATGASATLWFYCAGESTQAKFYSGVQHFYFFCLDRLCIHTQGKCEREHASKLFEMQHVKTQRTKRGDWSCDCNQAAMFQTPSGCYTIDIHKQKYNVGWFMSPQQLIYNRTPRTPQFPTWSSSSGQIPNSKTQSQDGYDRSRNQQSNHKCFTGTGQTNITSACELNCCSTWLLLNQLLPRKLTQTFCPAGKKCDCCA